MKNLNKITLIIKKYNLKDRDLKILRIIIRIISSILLAIVTTISTIFINIIDQYKDVNLYVYTSLLILIIIESILKILIIFSTVFYLYVLRYLKVLKI